MKVIKILNNNLVFARDDSGREVIVKGLGIGFHASRGDTVVVTNIDEYIRAVGMAKSGEAVEHGACLLTIV